METIPIGKGDVLLSCVGTEISQYMVDISGVGHS